MEKRKIIIQMFKLMLIDFLEFTNNVATTILKFLAPALAIITSMFLLVGLLGLLLIDIKGLTQDEKQVTFFYKLVVQGYVLSLLVWLINIKTWKRIQRFFKEYYYSAKQDIEIQEITNKRMNENKFTPPNKRPKSKKP